MANRPQVSIDTRKEQDMCFVCGPQNPVGLKVAFCWDGKEARAEFTPDRNHQGWLGVVHGGILGSLLDEAMSWAALFSGVSTVTAKMETRFRRSLPIDQPIVITGHLTRQNRKLAEAAAQIYLKDGAIIAEATATMFILGQADTSR
jgi:uncharacterized protein (TIGR00369 family)